MAEKRAVIVNVRSNSDWRVKMPFICDDCNNYNNNYNNGGDIVKITTAYCPSHRAGTSLTLWGRDQSMITSR